jgi:protein-S-isoprenylcysteine O-methyltransferase Ste14
MMKTEKLLPPAWFFLAIISMIGLNWAFPIKQLLGAPITYFGVAFIGMGLTIGMSSVYLFRQKETTIKPFEESSYLLTEGLYQYSRNPIYLGMIVTLVGLWLFLGTLSPAIVIPIFARLIQERFIKIEEQMLEEKFGTQYQEFQQKVRRWL